MFKKASQYFPGPQYFYSPLWQHVGTHVIEKIASTVFDPNSTSDELYIKERINDDGINEDKLLEFIQKHPRRPFIIKGPAGVGKTTFLAHTLSDDSANNSSFTPFWVNVDNVRGNTESPQELVQLVQYQIGSRIEQYIQNKASVIDWWKYFLTSWNDPRGITSLLALHVSQESNISNEVLAQLANLLQEISYLELIRLRFSFLCTVLNTRPIIIIDNADLLPSDFYPQLIKLSIDLSLGLALPSASTNDRTNECDDYATVIIALRPESLPSNARGTNTYLSDVLHPPKLDLVLKQRLGAILKQLEFHAIPNPLLKDRRGKVADLRFSDGTSSSLSEEEARELLLKVADALLIENRAHEQLIQLLLNLTNHSVRVSLVALANYIASGHHEWKPLLLSIRDKRRHRYFISKRKAQKVLFLGAQSLYSTSKSWPFNIFGDGKGDMQGVLGLLRILKICEAIPKAEHEKGISQTIITDHMAQLFNYTQKRTVEITQKLYSGGLLNDDDEPGLFKITIAGDRYLKIMTKNFEYLQHVVIDCYVDSSHLVECYDMDEHVSRRFDRVLRFAQWIRSLEVEEYKQVLKNSQEPLYNRIFGKKTVSLSLSKVLLDTFGALRELSEDPKVSELLKKPTEKLSNTSTISSIKHDAMIALEV